ncbi:hypothetical protein QOZ80_2BG0200330 [Eleusine coracana subsp. coracana]|nr:hypothetical protein QOZ80_2BG0200330 [Eleusine coracana subsp. coracana]
MDVPVKKKAAAMAVTARTPPRTGKAEMKPTTLLDVHEVEWITRELERLLAKEQGGGDDGGRHQRKGAKAMPAASKKGGFLADFLGKRAVSICSGDAVDSATSASSAAGVVGRGRRPRGRGNSGFREVEKV